MTQPRLLGDRYELEGVVGRGGMAEVYRARDLRLDRVVAIKTLRTDLARDQTFQARFRREAQSAASLNNPSIAAVDATGCFPSPSWRSSPVSVAPLSTATRRGSSTGTSSRGT